MKPVIKTTWEIGTPWELRTATSVPRFIHYVEKDLRNKTTSEFRTVFDSPLGVPNFPRFHCICLFSVIEISLCSRGGVGLLGNLVDRQAFADWNLQKGRNLYRRSLRKLQRYMYIITTVMPKRQLWKYRLLVLVVPMNSADGVPPSPHALPSIH